MMSQTRNSVNQSYVLIRLITSETSFLNNTDTKHPLVRNVKIINLLGLRVFSKICFNNMFKISSTVTIQWRRITLSKQCEICDKDLVGLQRKFCCDSHKMRFHNKTRTAMYHTVTRKEHGDNINHAIFESGVLSIACKIDSHYACKGFTKKYHKCRCMCHK
jgi:hypothetical protein